MAAKPPTSSAHPLPNPSPIKGEGLRSALLRLDANRVEGRGGVIVALARDTVI